MVSRRFSLSRRLTVLIKVNFGEEEFMNYFKEFLRPQISGDAVLIPFRIMSKYYYLVAGLPGTHT